ASAPPSPVASVNPALRPILKDKEWRPIFNEKDLRGWEKMGDFETVVTQSSLQIRATNSEGNAWLLSARDYRNFKLELEFMMDEETDSGILFRYNSNLPGNTNKLGYEANLRWETDCQEPLGTIGEVARSAVPSDLKKDSWNSCTIEANGDHLMVYINGKKVSESHNRRSLSGRVGIQVPRTKGHTITIRKIRIKELTDFVIAGPQVEDFYRSTADSKLHSIMEYDALDDWKNLGGGKWKLDQNGILHGFSDGQNSFFVYQKPCKNFYMKFKFKILKEDNSGIFIRKHPDSINVSLNDALECNIYDNNGYTHAYSTGSIVAHARAWSHMISYKDWNTMEIFAKDQLIIMYVNGQKSSEVTVPKKYDKAGNICLQVGPRFFSDRGSSNIYFKDIMLKNMDNL
ncbi:MAG: DUF1080 domain-containing protein, partial [Bacteroidota bacterium]